MLYQEKISVRSGPSRSVLVRSGPFRSVPVRSGPFRSKKKIIKKQIQKEFKVKIEKKGEKKWENKNRRNNSGIINYYSSLSSNNTTNNIRDRKERIRTSTGSMITYYRSIIDINKKSIIYNCFMNDKLRSCITRWRLSNHKLLIELGKYTIPPIPREDRKCLLCNVLEDEYHVYVCVSVFQNYSIEIQSDFE